MKFDLNRSLEILASTPAVLEALLSNLSDEWLHSNEGPDTWSPYDIAGHLVHGERSDWMERTNIILFGDDKYFKKFDRFAQFTESKGKTIHVLLAEFRKLREKNIEHVKSLQLTKDKLNMTGIHPAFGEVTLRQLLATWTVHDMNHLAQISRVLAKQYREETGPWIEYLPLLSK